MRHMQIFERKTILRISHEALSAIHKNNKVALASTLASCNKMQTPAH